MYPSANKKYTRKRPVTSFSLSTDVAMLIDSLSITTGINKSLVVEKLIRQVLEKIPMEEIVERLSV